MTQENNNKKSFWKRYKYVLLFTLIIPVVLVIVRALRSQKNEQNGTSQTDPNQNKGGIAQNTPNTDKVPSEGDKNTSNDTQKDLVPNNQDTVDADKQSEETEPENKSLDQNNATSKGSVKQLTKNNPYAKYYAPKMMAKKAKPVPESVTFYYPPNGKKKWSGRKLTTASPIKVKKAPKPAYKVEILSEPQAEILSTKTSIFANVELKDILLDRKVTQNGGGLIKKVYQTNKGNVGEVEMELWVLARHWERNDSRVINRVYCTNNEGTLSIDDINDARLYLEPVLNEEKVLFGTLQQMPQNNPIEVLDTQKKKFKSYNDHYNQYTWFKVKVKGYIKWHNKMDKKGK